MPIPQLHIREIPRSIIPTASTEHCLRWAKRKRKLKIRPTPMKNHSRSDSELHVLVCIFQLVTVKYGHYLMELI